MKESMTPKLSVHFIFLWTFSTLFLILCAALLLSTVSTFVQFFLSSGFLYKEHELPNTVLNGISDLIIALAIFELYVILKINVRVKPHSMQNLLEVAPRFLVIVSVALALEGLVLVIKLVQQDKILELAAPIALIICAALLLISLGLFLKICRRELRSEEETDRDTGSSS
ncbi:hypothetical protein SAMN05216562_0722 [Microbulbifer marinus]|uniref:Phosphate-starvation-inducible E n=1 Tax=Microbulbifer marinus TaxID=658218 RepID=A0A1H3WDX7_9GAMM|nr:hypothetical protein SAMN05216562_0722 [Microbulbifer marinus]